MMTVDKHDLGKVAKLMLERETLVFMSYKMRNQRFTLETVLGNGLSKEHVKRVVIPSHIARKFVVVLLEDNEEALRGLGVAV